MQGEKIPERDHGLGDIDGVIVGAPKVKQALAKGEPAPCPNCGCSELFLIEVQIEDSKQLTGGSGVGAYIGCPACPWASPMMARAQ